MKKSLKQSVAAVGLAFCLMTIADAATSITYTVGGWQITATDLGLLPGGSASGANAINNQGRIVGLATDSAWNLQRPVWDANTGAVIDLADNFDPASTAIPEHFNDSGEMAGTESINQNIYYGVYWNPAGQAFGLLPLAGAEPFYGSRHTKAHGINSLGQIVGAGKDTVNFSLHAVLWLNKDTPGQDLGFLGKGAYVDYSEAYGINDFGHVVGNSALGTAMRGFLWRNGIMINLAALSGTASEGTSASALNNKGLAVGKSNLYPVTWRYDIAKIGATGALRRAPRRRLEPSRVSARMFTPGPAASRQN